MLKCRHIINKNEKKVCRVLKKDIYEFSHINDAANSCDKNRIVTANKEYPNTVPQIGETDKCMKG